MYGMTLYVYKYIGSMMPGMWGTHIISAVATRHVELAAYNERSLWRLPWLSSGHQLCAALLAVASRLPHYLLALARLPSSCALFTLLGCLPPPFLSISCMHALICMLPSPCTYACAAHCLMLLQRHCSGVAAAHQRLVDEYLRPWSAQGVDAGILSRWPGHAYVHQNQLYMGPDLERTRLMPTYMHMISVRTPMLDPCHCVKVTCVCCLPVTLHVLASGCKW